MIYERLIENYNSGRVPFSMPGHKQNRGLDRTLLELDTTEVLGGVDLHGESPDVRESEKALSDFYGSGRSFYMTGGSTAGVHASILACAKTGDTIALTRTCHVSAVNFCAIAGINAVMIPQRISEDYLVPEPVRAEDVERAILQNQSIRLVMITTPSYYGQCTETEEIARVCHRYNIPLIADAAHGAHFITGEPFPETALSLGADIEINSAHKTLNALTGAAYIHIRSAIVDTERLRRALAMVQSSSPPYPILASAELAWRELREKPDIWRETAEKCEKFKSEINIPFMKNSDPTRLVMSFAGLNIAGFEAAEYFSKNGIDTEMADHTNVVCIASPSNTDEDFASLRDTVNALVKTLKKANPPQMPKIPQEIRTIYPQAGFWGTDKRLSDRTVMIYPPAAPIVAMGEIIKEEEI